MKILHCADLHLDSKMTSNLDREKARVRKGEMLHTFERMVGYADDNGIEIILMAGDLFDAKNISATARNTVLHTIKSHPDIHFYYIRGNHDQDNFMMNLEEPLENLKMFGDKWMRYDEGKVSIFGLELTAENVGSAPMTIVAEPDRFNIVMLHGQEAEVAAVKDKTEIIPLKAFRDKSLDYLALGHIHARKFENLDRRCSYCYPGCLEGRGFDECGDHGFVVIDINEETGSYSHEFINFAYRKLYWLEADVTGTMSSAQIIDIVDEVLAAAGCEDSSLVRIELVGSLDVESEKDADYIVSHFSDRFFYFQLKDETVLHVETADYMLDESLKGEFVRMVMADEKLSDEDKAAVIRYGFCALRGEEVQ